MIKLFQQKFYFLEVPNQYDTTDEAVLISGINAQVWESNNCVFFSIACLRQQAGVPRPAWVAMLQGPKVPGMATSSMLQYHLIYLKGFWLRTRWMNFTQFWVFRFTEEPSCTVPVCKANPEVFKVNLHCTKLCTGLFCADILKLHIEKF